MNRIKNGKHPELNMFGEHAEIHDKCNKVYSWDAGCNRPKFCENCGGKITHHIPFKE